MTLTSDINENGKQTDKTVQDNRHSTVEFLLRRIRRSEAFPAISKYITEIQKLTSGDNSASDLAKVVLKDCALTTKLLKLANSTFYYGIEGKRINSITQAIVKLGFEQVRMAATSIILFEHLKGGDNVSGLCF